jgi:hypothetical protein
MRAAELAASQPAWPPPITRTSNRLFIMSLGKQLVAEAMGRVKKPGKPQNVSRETLKKGRSPPV